MNLSQFLPAGALGRRSVLLVAFVSMLVLIEICRLQLDSHAQNAFYKAFGLSREGLAQGHVWQFFSYALLHGGWIHISVNALGLLFLGQRVIWILGVRSFWTVTVAGIVFGGLCQLLDPRDPVLVGISGGVCALLMILAVLEPDARFWPLPLKGRSIGIGCLLATACLALWTLLQGFGVIHGSLKNQASSSLCHFGGFLIGYAMGHWKLRPRINLQELKAQRLKRERNES